MRTYLLAISLLLLSVVPAAAQAPDVTTIIAKAKAALEPSRPSTRKMTISINLGGGGATKWNAFEARDRLQDSNWLLVVMQSPAGAKGIGFLTREKAGERTVMWDYIPVVGRVRELTAVRSYDPFFGTDFSYADMGLFDLRGKHKLLGEENRDGVKTYKVQGLSPDDIYDSKVISWIATTNFLPVERDFFDKAGRLWKVERYKDVKDIQGVPTVTKIEMEDKQAGTSSGLEFSDVHYDAKVPAELFDPQKLSVASDNSALGGTAAH